MSSEELPHPVQINVPRELLERDYLNVTVDRCAHRAWQFRLNLHKTTRIAPGGETAPSVEQPFATMALFQRPDPLADFEIFGLQMPAEIHPADWLDLWIEQHKLVVVSSKPIATPRGVFGDCVCTWETPEGPFAGRFVTMKWGQRLSMLALRTARNLYPAIADDFFLAVASFTPVETDQGEALAEALQTVNIPSPVKCRTSLPASYALVPDVSDARISVFSADQQGIGALPNDPPFGKLNFLFAERSLADHPAKAAAIYLNPLMQNPVRIERDEFEEEAPPAPFDQAWRMVTPATLSPAGGETISCELRCRVLYHPKGWFVTGALGPAREVGPIAWMRNKRAFDCVCQNVTME